MSSIAFSDSPIERFLTHWCSPDLTPVQVTVTKAMVAQGRVIGVARAIGGIDFFPLVSFGAQQPNVIDRAGYYQLASSTGMRLFSPEDQLEYELTRGEPS